MVLTFRQSYNFMVHPILISKPFPSNILAKKYRFADAMCYPISKCYRKTREQKLPKSLFELLMTSFKLW